jgi:hypothetical protein
MGMRIGFLPVIPVGPVGKTKFKNFTKGFDNADISVHSCKTHGWKICFKLFVYHFSTGVIHAFRQDFYNGEPLGRYLVTLIF